MDALYSKTPIHCDFLECVQCVKYVYTLHKDGKNVMKPNSAYPYKIINVIPVEEQLKDMGRETIDKTFCSDFFNQVLQDAAKRVMSNATFIVDDTKSFYNYTAWGEILLKTNVVHLIQCCYITTKIYSSLCVNLSLRVSRTFILFSKLKSSVETQLRGTI